MSGERIELENARAARDARLLAGLLARAPWVGGRGWSERGRGRAGGDRQSKTARAAPQVGAAQRWDQQL